jgi:hypothetical protein
MMNLTKSSLITVAILISGAHADTFQLTGEGIAEEWRPSFAGSDAFPFLGIETNDLISFQFEYDTDTAPHTIDGNIARYTFAGTNSFFVIGDNTMSVDTFELGVGTTDSGLGVIDMLGRNEEHGISANISFTSTHTTLPMDVPTLLDLNLFNSFREFSVNSDLNQFLLSNLFGPIQNASIVPAPGTLAMGLCVGTLMTRRRRA